MIMQSLIIIHYTYTQHAEASKLDCTFTGNKQDCDVLLNALNDTNPKLFDHANITEASLYSDGTKTGF